MARAVGDPESIKNLGRRVKRASDDLERVARELESALKATDWNDSVRRAFERDLEQLVRRVREFKGAADNAEKHLNRKAADLEKYLRG